MNKIITLIVFSFIVSNGIAQQQNNSNYPNSLTLKEAGNLDDYGYPVGQWKYFREDGNLEYTIDWDANYTRTYHKNGVLKEEGTFIPETGVHIGTWITYDQNGKIISEKTYDENGVEISAEPK